MQEWIVEVERVVTEQPEPQPSESESESESDELSPWYLTEPAIEPLGHKQLTPRDHALHLLTLVLHGERNDLAGEFGVTVTSNGAVVSGLAISAARWEGLFAQSLIDSGQDSIGRALGKSLARQRRLLGRVYDERDAKDLSPMVPAYLHFREATLINGSSPIRLPLWRARLDSIDGWSLGNDRHPDGVAWDDVTYTDFSKPSPEPED